MIRICRKRNEKGREGLAVPYSPPSTPYSAVGFNQRSSILSNPDPDEVDTVTSHRAFHS